MTGKAQGVSLHVLNTCFGTLPRSFKVARWLLAYPEQIAYAPVLRIIRRDPLLAAYLLGMANGAYYSPKNPIASLKQVVIMLGPVTVIGVIFGLNLLESGSAHPKEMKRLMPSLIRHSLATAMLSRFLHNEAANDASFEEVSYLAGLLHDFGKILLLRGAPKRAALLYDVPLPTRPSSERLREEARLLGSDHTQAGELIAKAMHFPATLKHVIRYHHDRAAAASSAIEARLLRLTAAASLAANFMGYGSAEALSYKMYLADPIWELVMRYDFPRYDSPTRLLRRLDGQRILVNAELRQLFPTVHTMETRNGPIGLAS